MDLVSWLFWGGLGLVALRGLWDVWGALEEEFAKNDLRVARDVREAEERGYRRAMEERAGAGE